jgi:hypothetical protein
MLKHASFPAAAVTPAATISSGSRPKSIFASLLDALHHSRRVQTRRVLTQYGHLVSPHDPRQTLDLLNLEGSEHVGQ